MGLSNVWAIIRFILRLVPSIFLRMTLFAVGMVFLGIALFALLLILAWHLRLDFKAMRTASGSHVDENAYAERTEVRTFATWY